MHKPIILLISLLLALGTNAQNLEWAKSFGKNSSDYGVSITVDASGNVYTTGRFQQTVDFDPGAGTNNLSSQGLTDAFIQKLDPSGNFLWAKSFGGTSQDEGLSITVDASGNVYTTGWFSGTVDFDPGAGTNNHTSQGSRDVFIQKLDPSGNFLWAKSFGGTSDDYGNSITVDASGNVYTTGWFSGTGDFNPGAGTNNLTSQGSNDVFIQKLDPSGNFLWAKSFGGTSSNYGLSITVDASGNVYTTGKFSGTVDFDPGAGTNNLSSQGSNDVFIQKLDPSGYFLWAKSFGGTSIDVAYSIALDASGNVYTTGDFKGTVDFDPGAGTNNLSSQVNNLNSQSVDVFIQKLDPSGNFLWAKSFGGTSGDGGRSITVDASGNVYTTGYFQGTADFDPGAGTNNLTSQGSNDVFIQKLDPSGNFLWAKSFGGNLDDYGWSITVDASGNVYTTGSFKGAADFDPGAGTNNLSSQGSYDVFIQKMSPCSPTTGTDVQTACDTYTWIDGNTYTASNNAASVTLTNAAGCDSVVTLDLTIINSATGTDTRTECNTYTWIDGNTYTASNNSATFNIVGGAANGCDSLVALDLTIINSATGTDTRTECNTYTWIDGNTYTASNNSATFNIVGGAANGCDSLVSLDLTIINSATGTDTRTECNTYTWIDGNTYTASNNSATFNIVGGAANGCDSLVALDLTIINSATGTDTRTECNTYTWIDGNTYTASNNSATFNIVGGAANGCDSLVTLNLTINSVSDLSTSISGVTISANNSNATYQWLDCDNGNSEINGEIGQSFTATTNGNYAVVLTESGCIDTSDCVAITSVGIIENSFGNKLIVYPNPTNGNFSVDLGAIYENTQVLITDISGKLIESVNKSQTQVLNLSINEADGIYFVSIHAENKNAVIRLVKQ
jgi:hypothetical protein